MKPKIPINPFHEEEEKYHKDPNDMSLEELELLLYTKRMELKLDLMRLEGKINYTKIIIDTIVSLGIPEKIEKYIFQFYGNSTPKQEKTES
jgi:hypothetical protein